MKFKIKIGKFLKLYKNESSGDVDEDFDDSMYWLIDEYLSTHHQCDITLHTDALDYAFFKMVKKIDRSKLAVDIFVAEPKFTSNSPTDLVKPEYRGVFISPNEDFISKKFLQLLKFAGVEEFFIKCDRDGCIDVEYDEVE